MLLVRKLSSEGVTFPRSLSLRLEGCDGNSGLSGSKVPGPPMLSGCSLNPPCLTEGHTQQGHLRAVGRGVNECLELGF